MWVKKTKKGKGIMQITIKRINLPTPDVNNFSEMVENLLRLYEA
jgi:hypothetical protein